MKLFVPNCKTELILTAPWTFRLYPERRNMSFGQKLGHFTDIRANWGLYGENMVNVVVSVTLPKGTIFRVRRVYIRQGTADTYDSLTFSVKHLDWNGTGKKVIKAGLFWAKLKDVNMMECDVYLGPNTEGLTQAELTSRMELLFD